MIMMPVRRTQNWLPSIFNDFFDNDWMVKANATAPAINVFETEKEYKVELAAPGMTKEDFNVHIDEENNLVISMEKKTENKEEKKERPLSASRILILQIPTDNDPSGRCRQRKDFRPSRKRRIEHRLAEVFRTGKRKGQKIH